MSPRRCIPAAEVIPPDLSPSAEKDESLARLAWALAHPIRVRILRILLAQSACVCGELVDQLPLSQSTVSQHLKILRDAGLIQGEVEGPKICYRANTEAIGKANELIHDLLAQH